MFKFETLEIIAGFFICFTLVLLMSIGILKYSLGYSFLNGVVVGLGYVIGTIIYNVVFIKKDKGDKK